MHSAGGRHYCSQGGAEGPSLYATCCGLLLARGPSTDKKLRGISACHVSSRESHGISCRTLETRARRRPSTSAMASSQTAPSCACTTPRSARIRSTGKNFPHCKPWPSDKIQNPALCISRARRQDALLPATCPEVPILAANSEVYRFSSKQQVCFSATLRRGCAGWLHAAVGARRCAKHS